MANDMALASPNSATIACTERGLTIAGTRITLYDVMDYVTEQYPAKFIQALFNLTEAQIDAALSYIETNRVDVEAEYQRVLEEAEALRLYYEERNRPLREKIARLPPSGARSSLGKTAGSEGKTPVQAMIFLIDYNLNGPVRKLEWKPPGGGFHSNFRISLMDRH